MIKHSIGDIDDILDELIFAARVASEDTSKTKAQIKEDLLAIKPEPDTRPNLDGHAKSFAEGYNQALSDFWAKILNYLGEDNE